MDLSKNTIIGIHTGASKFDFNKGYFIKNPIIEFIQNERKNKLDNNNKDIKSSKNVLINKQINMINNKYVHEKNLNPMIKIIQKEDKSKSDNKIINKKIIIKIFNQLKTKFIIIV